MSRRIVFIGDDFGMNRDLNRAVLATHRRGVLDGASLMMGQAATEDAIALARTEPTLEIGWHLHLLDSKPLTQERWPWGASPVAAGLALAGSPRARRLAREEIRLQWEAFEQSGLHCRFVNAHHHLHLHPLVRDTLLETLPRHFDGWLRWGRLRFFDRPPPGPRILARCQRLLQRRQPERYGLRYSTSLWGLDRLFAMEANQIAAVVPLLGDGLHEFLFHPRRIDDADSRCLLALRQRLPQLR